MLEWLLSWEVSSWIVGGLVAVAFAVLAFDDFRLAKLFFLIAAADAIGGVAMWGTRSDSPTWQVAVAAFIVIGGIGALTVMAFRYVDGKRTSKASLVRAEDMSFLLSEVERWPMMRVVIPEGGNFETEIEKALPSSPSFTIKTCGYYDAMNVVLLNNGRGRIKNATLSLWSLSEITGTGEGAKQFSPMQVNYPIAELPPASDTGLSLVFSIKIKVEPRVLIAASLDSEMIRPVSAFGLIKYTRISAKDAVETFLGMPNVYFEDNKFLLPDGHSYVQAPSIVTFDRPTNTSIVVTFLGDSVGSLIALNALVGLAAPLAKKASEHEDLMRTHPDVAPFPFSGRVIVYYDGHVTTQQRNALERAFQERALSLDIRSRSGPCRSNSKPEATQRTGAN